MVSKLLYCTCAPLGLVDNGGSLVCREHLRRLADTGVDLHVCAIGNQEHPPDKFIRSLGARHYSFPLPSSPDLPPNWATKLCPAWQWPFSFERLGIANRLVDVEFRSLLDRLSPDVVVIDYLPTAIFIPSVFASKVPIVSITQNPEVQLHREARKSEGLPSYVSKSIIAEWRLARFERAVYKSSNAVVALSEGDLPPGLGPNIRATVIQPVLDKSPRRWRHMNTRRLFFVGNIAHYPNFQAIKWLSEQFAPAVEQICPGACLEIAGAETARVPPSWRRRNIQFLGSASQEQIEKSFTECGLFIAPIANNFGAKIKILACLAHGTPILATRGALSGVPFKDVVPQFSLTDPAGAAKLAAEMLGCEQRLTQLSQVLTLERDRLAQSRQATWNHVIEEVSNQQVQSRSLAFWSPFRSCLGFLQGFLRDVRKPWPRRLEVGVTQPIGAESSGFYSGENFNGQPLRWTAQKAHIKVTLNQATLPNSMILALHGIAPPNGTTFRICVNGTELLRGQVRDQTVEKELLLPPLAGLEHLLIQLESSPSSSHHPDDPRDLGLALKSIALVRYPKWLSYWKPWAPAAGRALGKSASYTLGHPIDFKASGNFKNFLGYGWAESEPWGTWSKDETATLRLSPEMKRKADLVLTARLYPFLSPQTPRQEVNVLVNGRFAGSWSFNSFGMTVRSLRLPADLVQDFQTVEIAFVTKTALSPAELGLSDDQRRFGIGIAEVSLRVTEDSVPETSSIPRAAF